MAIIGMLVIMGISKLPTLEMYWSTNYSELAPLIRGVMPRYRFRKLLRFLHINSIDSSQDTTTPNYDGLYKVRNFIYYATSHICISLYTNQGGIS